MVTVYRVLMVLLCFSLCSSWNYHNSDDPNAKRFQKSYSVAVWGNPISVDYADISYGYILYNYHDLATNDKDLHTAMRTIWKELCGKEILVSKMKQHYRWSEMSIENVKITFARSQELRYTKDGKNWMAGFSYLSNVPVNVVMGNNYYVQFIAPDNYNDLLIHNITISNDRENNYYLYHHSFVLASSSYKEAIGEIGFISLVNRLTRQTSLMKQLRVLSYNAWNTMPANWFIRGKERFNWYYKRMVLMGEYINNANPDIVVLQEIRYDETLGARHYRFQLSHLAEYLPNYQYIYQPANMYVEGQARVEEGVAIFSKFPIVQQDYILLSRNYDDKHDDHQRVVLHATIDVPYLGLIHVYGTHLSLSEDARDRTVPELSAFIDKNGYSGFSVFCGDLNAEPDSRAIQYLIGKGQLNGKHTDYRDAFLEIHPEPKPQSKNEGVRRKGLTFPTDNPIKRIDYIIYKQGKGVHVKVYNSQLIGLKPWKGTETNDMSAGMMSKNSAIYASDHRGVFADFLFN